jgi:hypothetical protein
METFQSSDGRPQTWESWNREDRPRDISIGPTDCDYFQAPSLFVQLCQTLILV